MVGWLAVLVCTAGCVDAGVVTCADDRVCPLGTVCDETHHTCVHPDQLTACGGDPDRTPCSFADSAGFCLDDVCIPEGCGDGVVTAPEECDRNDLGLATDCSGLGFYGEGALTCTDECIYDESACAGLGICGDHQIDSFMVGGVLRTEACDAAPGEVVSTCALQGFYSGTDVTCNGACSYDTSGCSGTCGDGFHDPPELCDGKPPNESCIDLGYDLGFLDCSPLCGADQTLCHKIGLDRLNIPTTATVVELTGGSASDIYLIDADDKLFHFDGTAWAPVTLPVGERPVAVWSVGVDDTYLLVGQDLGLYLLHGSAGAWVDTGVMVVSGTSGILWASGPDDVYLFAPGHSTHWDGTQWSKLNQLNGLSYFVDAGGTGPGDVWLIATSPIESDVLWHFDGSVLTHLDSPTSSPNAVWAAAEDDVWVGGVELAHYGSEGWEEFVQPQPGSVAAIWGTAGNDVYAALDESVMHFDGTAWTNLADTGKDLMDVWGSGPSNVFVSGVLGTLLNYHGALWRDTGFASPTAQLGGVYAASAEDVFVVEVDPAGFIPLGRVHHFDGANGWSVELEQVTVLFSAIWGSSNSDVYAVSDQGEIWHRDASDWSQDIVLTGAQLHGIWGYGPDAVYAVGASIARRDAGGWELETMPITTQLNGVWGSSATDVYAVGDGGSILHRDALGDWQVEVSGTSENLEAVWGSSADSVWAVGGNGTLLHRTGGAWQAIETNSFAVFSGVTGTPDDELFIASFQGLLYHWDGVHLSPMKPDDGLSPLSGATALEAGQTTMFVGEGRLLRLYRSIDWLAP